MRGVVFDEVKYYINRFTIDKHMVINGFLVVLWKHLGAPCFQLW